LANSLLSLLHLFLSRHLDIVNQDRQGRSGGYPRRRTTSWRLDCWRFRRLRSLSYT